MLASVAPDRITQDPAGLLTVSTIYSLRSFLTSNCRIGADSPCLGHDEENIKKLTRRARITSLRFTYGLSRPVNMEVPETRSRGIYVEGPFQFSCRVLPVSS